jgi:hypothetical protein
MEKETYIEGCIGTYAFFISSIFDLVIGLWFRRAKFLVRQKKFTVYILMETPDIKHIKCINMLKRRWTKFRFLYFDFMTYERMSYLSTALQSFLVDLGHFFSSSIPYTVCRTPRRGNQPVAKPLPTHRTTKTQKKRTQTFIPRVGFEPTIPAFKQVQTVHATVFGLVVGQK